MKKTDLSKFKEGLRDRQIYNLPVTLVQKPRAIPPWIIDCPQLNPPFTWFGGKRAVADLVWKKFGEDIPNYIEPFAGGLAVLLRRPVTDFEQFGRFYETFNDQNLFLLNFWRAVQYGDLSELLKYADFPAHEKEILARRRYMMDRQEELEGKLKFKAEIAAEDETDPEIKESELHARGEYQLNKDLFAAKLENYRNFDVEIAGLWLYVTRNWIGAGADDPDSYPLQKMPCKIKKGWLGGSPEAHLSCLQQRLKSAMGFVGGWDRVVKSKTQTTDRGRTGVFLDPPYRGTEDYYAGFSDEMPSRSSIADDVDDWALAHGDNEDFRIAVCGYEENFQKDEYLKRRWYLNKYKARIGMRSGNKDSDMRKEIVEITAFSPYCLPTRIEPKSAD